MEAIFPPETSAKWPIRSVDELIHKFLRHEHPVSRGMAAIHLAHKIAQDYERISRILLAELPDPLHFPWPRLGHPSSVVIAIVLAENLKPGDFPLLRAAISQWPAEQIDDLAVTLRHSPAHKEILLGTSE